MIKFGTILILILISTRLFGQDIISQDLKSLSGIEFFKKYTNNDVPTSKEDIKVILKVWTFERFLKSDSALRKDGIKTFTRIDDRPSKELQYYIVGHYRWTTSDHFTLIENYQVSADCEKIQSVDDFLMEIIRRYGID